MSLINYNIDSNNNNNNNNDNINNDNINIINDTINTINNTIKSLLKSNELINLNEIKSLLNLDFKCNEINQLEDLLSNIIVLKCKNIIPIDIYFCLFNSIISNNINYANVILNIVLNTNDIHSLYSFIYIVNSKMSFQIIDSLLNHILNYIKSNSTIDVLLFDSLLLLLNINIHIDYILLFILNHSDVFVVSNLVFNSLNERYVYYSFLYNYIRLLSSNINTVINSSPLSNFILLFNNLFNYYSLSLLNYVCFNIIYYLYSVIVVTLDLLYHLLSFVDFHFFVDFLVILLNNDFVNILYNSFLKLVNYYNVITISVVDYVVLSNILDILSSINSIYFNLFFDIQITSDVKLLYVNFIINLFFTVLPIVDSFIDIIPVSNTVVVYSIYLFISSLDFDCLFNTFIQNIDIIDVDLKNKFIVCSNSLFDVFLKVYSMFNSNHSFIVSLLLNLFINKNIINTFVHSDLLNCVLDLLLSGNHSFVLFLLLNSLLSIYDYNVVLSTYSFSDIHSLILLLLNYVLSFNQNNRFNKIIILLNLLYVLFHCLLSISIDDDDNVNHSIHSLFDYLNSDNIKSIIISVLSLLHPLIKRKDENENEKIQLNMNYIIYSLISNSLNSLNTLNDYYINITELYNIIDE